MSTTLLFLLSCFVAFMAAVVAAWAATAWLIPLLQRRAVLDVPNHRSSHTVPTPRGGGWAVLAAWGVGLFVLCGVAAMPTRLLWLLPAIGVLAFISWCDDKAHIRWSIRMALQLCAVLCGVQALPQGLIFQGVMPAWLEMVGSVLFWLWFINLTNFVDGIDGITGANAFMLGLGVAVVAMMSGERPWLTPTALILAGSALGFLYYNWHPARVFLGDVGSVPIGFISAFLLLTLAQNGHAASAILIGLVPFMDATHTLLLRLARGENITQAHRDHAYQRALINGKTPPQIVLRIIGVNGILLILACMAAIVPDVPTQGMLVAFGVMCVAVLLWGLRKSLPSPCGRG